MLHGEGKSAEALRCKHFNPFDNILLLYCEIFDLTLVFLGTSLLRNQSWDAATNNSWIGSFAHHRNLASGNILDNSGHHFARRGEVEVFYSLILFYLSLNLDSEDSRVPVDELN